MIDPNRPEIRRDGNVDPRILDHPLGVIRVRPLCEQRGVKPHGLIDVFDANVYNEFLHARFPFG
jgi:hypothetical protein